MRLVWGVSTRQMFMLSPVNLGGFFFLFTYKWVVDLVFCLFKNLLFFGCLYIFPSFGSRCLISIFHQLYAEYLSDTVRHCCLQSEGQGDLHLPDRRSPRRIFQKELRAPRRRSSSRANTPGNSPEGENQRVKGQL